MKTLTFVQKIIAFCMHALGAVKFWQPDAPLVIQGYTFLKRTTVAGKTPFFTALYKNNEDKIVHIKASNRHPLNIHFHNLRHEAAMLSLLSNLKPFKMGNLSVSAPRFIKTITTGTHLCVVTEQAKGNSLKQTTPAAQLTLHTCCTAYLSYAYQKLWGKMTFIPYKGRRYYLSTLPLIMVLATITHPKHRSLILKACKVLFQNAYLFFSSQQISLVHGDLHVDNIFVDHNRITILDLGQLMRTFKEYEFVTSFSSIRNKEVFNTSLLNRFLKVSDPAEFKYRTLLILLCSLHNLTSGAASENNEWYLFLLDKVLKLHTKKSQKEQMRIPNFRLRRIAV